MFVFVTSSPYIEGAPGAFLSNVNGFVDRIRSVLPENPAALFIASDPDDHSGTCRFAGETAAAFALEGMAFSSYHVLTGRTQHQAYSMIRACDLIVLCGGHVPTQNAFFRKIRLRHMLRHFDGTVLGISAGSMNSADRVYVQPEEPGESVPEFQRFAPGLALTGVNILPHYQKVKDNYLDGLRLFEDITYADSMGNTFYPLPDNSYFYQDEDGLLLFGVILLPYTQGLRYLFNVLPFLLLLIAYGGQYVFHVLSTKIPWKYLKVFLYTVAVVILVLAYIPHVRNGIENLTSDQPISVKDVYSEDGIEMYRYIQENTAKDDIIASYKPRALYLNTGRISFLPTVNNHTLDEATYFLYTKYPQAHLYNKLMEESADRLDLIYANETFSLYKITQP